MNRTLEDSEISFGVSSYSWIFNNLENTEPSEWAVTGPLTIVPPAPLVYSPTHPVQSEYQGFFLSGVRTQ